MIDRQHDSPLKVSILVLPQSTPAALYGLFEVFASVGRTWEELTGEPSDAPTLEPRLVARTLDPIPSALGFSITPNGLLDEADVVIVTDIAIPDPGRLPAVWEPELDWLRERQAAGAILCSVCTGSVVLAEAGLLDGLEATTHWCTVDFMRSRYPGVRIAPQKILVADGPGDQIVTGGGATAWEDMALYLVARLATPAEAVRIAKIFLLGDHSEGQLPFAGAKKPRRHEDRIVADIQTWIADNYHLSNPVALMVVLERMRCATRPRGRRTARSDAEPGRPDESEPRAHHAEAAERQGGYQNEKAEPGRSRRARGRSAPSGGEASGSGQ
jgi:transcriptional regulator GlxA family with amidase domain